MLAYSSRPCFVGIEVSVRPQTLCLDPSDSLHLEGHLGTRGLLSLTQTLGLVLQWAQSPSLDLRVTQTGIQLLVASVTLEPPQSSGRLKLSLSLEGAEKGADEGRRKQSLFRAARRETGRLRSCAQFSAKQHACVPARVGT